MGGWFADVLHLWAHIRAEYVRTERGVELYCYKNTTAWDRAHKHKAAFSLGELAVFRSMEDMTERNVKHELKHCEQIRKRGGFLRFYPGYCYESAKAWILTGDTDNNPFEREACQAECE